MSKSDIALPGKAVLLPYPRQSFWGKERLCRRQNGQARCDLHGDFSLAEQLSWDIGVREQAAYLCRSTMTSAPVRANVNGVNKVKKNLQLIQYFVHSVPLTVECV